MQATDFEFRYRFFLFGLIYLAGFGVRSAHHPPTFAESIAGLTGPSSRLSVQLCFALAAVIIALAAALRTWATAYLQGEIVHDMAMHSQHLVADGPYRYVRNPLYLGTNLLALGIGFLAPAPNCLFLVIATLIFNLRLIFREEAGLQAGHSQSFLKFKAAVPRLFPSLTPRLPASGRQPHWRQAWLAESFMWAFAVSMLIFAVTLNGPALTKLMMLILLCYAILHVVNSQRQKHAASRPAVRMLLCCILFVSVSGARDGVSLRGLIVTPSGAVWASGSHATVLRQANNSHATPETCAKPPDSASLDFRGLYARDAQNALVMSAGTGPLSRLFETTDGCSTWRLLFTNPDPQGFWDTLAFNPRHPNSGVILGDPVDGRFTIFRTVDGGQTWTRDSSPALASSPAGEGAFAASNSSLVILNQAGDLLFGTGGLGGPRIFRFDARGQSWTNVPIPVADKNETSGIFSLACRSERLCMAVGGDYKHPANREGTGFLTRDGGRSWASTAAAPRGYRSAVTWNKGTWIAAGPTGADASRDDGAHWTALNDQNWNALNRNWAAGANSELKKTR